MKKIAVAALFAVMTMSGYAQSGTNSPYSQYGLGVLSEQSNGFNRGMNGLALGFREHNQVNYLNPASYSAIDSLSFIFDMGVSGQITNFKEGNTKVNANNADFEYAVGGFRVARHVGMAFGIVPFTNIGYNYASTNNLVTSSAPTSSAATTYTNTLSGDGGVHEVFLGAGWQPLKGFSFGANIGYIWGSLNRSVVTSYSDAYVKSLARYYTADVRSVHFNVGVQYTQHLNKNDEMTLGLTYSLGNKMTGDAVMQDISTDPQSSQSDTTSYSIGDAYRIPHMFGVGIMYNHANQLKVGADYSFQKWSGILYPTYINSNGQRDYVLRDGVYQNRHKFTLGGEYCYGEYDRRFLRRVKYRLGVSYATPYYKINGQDGPKEYSVSAGFGIPIINSINNRSILNISGQFVRTEATGMIKENTFRINIGLTFNERWFAKWKVE